MKIILMHSLLVYATKRDDFLPLLWKLLRFTTQQTKTVKKKKEKLNIKDKLWGFALQTRS